MWISIDQMMGFHKAFMENCLPWDNKVCGGMDVQYICVLKLGGETVIGGEPLASSYHSLSS